MTIVVGYIPNEYGEVALSVAIEEARRRGLRLVVVNSTRGDALVDRTYVGESAAHDLAARLAGLDVVSELRQPMGADVAEEIITVARDVGAELVVIGLRHRTPVGKILMGSVAQEVLLGAPCPVLTVKPAY